MKRNTAILQVFCLVVTTVRNILAFAVTVGVVGRLAVGLPFAVISCFALIPVAVLLVSHRTLSFAHWLVATIFWALDAVFAAVTVFAFCLIAGYVDSPFGAPDDLPLWGWFVTSAVIGALSAAFSLFVSICSLANAVFFCRKSPSLETVALVNTPPPSSSATTEDTPGVTPPPSSPRPEKPVLRRRYESAAVLVALGCCAALGIVALALTVASLTSLGLAVSGSGCTQEDNGCFEDCETLGAGGCMLPWPSSFFLISDNSTDTRLRMKLPRTAMPHVRSGGRIKPDHWNELDGFALTAPALFDLPLASSIVFDHHGANTTLPLLANSTMAHSEQLLTAIIDADTLELVPHWAELDSVRWSSKNERPLVILQPAVPLKYGTRYVAAVRGLLDAASGSFAPAASGFASLLKEQTGERWPWMHDKVLPVVHNALGWSDNELQLAWDWTTTSRSRALGRIEAMRDDAATRSISYKRKSVRTFDCSASGATIARSIVGSLVLPSYLVGGHKRGSLLAARPGEEASVSPTGTISADFLVEIPCSVVAGGKPVQIIQYGHGFFGGVQEIQRDFLRDLANRYGWILFGADWRGMSRYDILFVAKAFVSDPGHIAILSEEISQGHIVFDSLMRLMRTQFVNDHSVASANGTSLIDPNLPALYYGISQGGILGGAYTAISKEIQRAVLGVPGGSLALIMSRSTTWSMFGPAFRYSLFNQRDARLFISQLQCLCEPAESAGWTEELAKKPVLIQSALGDALVANQATHLLARALNASTLYPQTRPIAFITERKANFSHASAIVEWRYDDVPEVPLENIPPSSATDTHECPRRELKAQEQLRIFLESGTILQTCNGTCIQAHLCKK